MRRYILPFGIAILSFAVSSAGAQPLDQFRIGLEISPQVTLPGIPVTFRITLTNPIAVPLTLPFHALIVATDEAGESFLVWPKPILLQDVWKAAVPAGGSAVVELRPQGSFNDGSQFVEEPRLNRPGRFRFHVLAGKFTSSEPGFWSIPDGGTRSADVELHIIEPLGVDRDVWRALQRDQHGELRRVWFPSSGGSWAFYARIVREFPYSQYAGWIAASGVSEKSHDSAEALRNWLGRAAHDEYTEAREIKLALFDETAASQWSQISEDEVRRHLRSARALLEKLKDSKDLKISLLARQRLVELAEVEENARERGPRVP